MSAISPFDLRAPAVFCDGTAYLLQWGNDSSPSYFGGPSDLRFTGALARRARLHHVLTLGGGIIPAMEQQHVFKLPLFYGFCHDGGQLKYRLPEERTSELLELEPRQVSADFPYPDYPALLLHLPLRLDQRRDCTPADFARFTWQGLEIKPSMLVVIVPPILVGGVSMWGPDGDAEGVQVIFECDFETHTVRGSNQCG
jgi:hypothetical protein